MKFSYQWISEFVKGLDAEATMLERLITTRTAECDGIETAGEPLASKSRSGYVVTAGEPDVTL